MFDRASIKARLLEQGLDLNRVWVGFGGSMVMFGLRETTRDIDISCERDYFSELLTRVRGEVETGLSGSRMMGLGNGIDVHEEVRDDTELVNIDGLMVEKLEVVRRWKLKLGREKDLKDVQVIDEYLGLRG